MRTIRLGKSDMDVTRVGFGGIPVQRLNDEESIKLIRHALERGMNWIDTAHGYGPSEERVGRAIEGCERETVMLFTKGPAQSADEIRRQLHVSLERLKTDYVDLYQFHNVKDPETWRRMQDNGTVEVVLEAKKQGLVRHIGASAHKSDAAMAVLDHEAIEVFQWPFNFVVCNEAVAVLEKCRERDIGFIAMKPFGGGVLDDASVCIRFFYEYSDIVLDPGFERTEEVDEVVELIDAEGALSPADAAMIERFRSELGTRFCRRCGYCMPCPYGVNVTGLMTMTSFLRRFPPEKILNGNPARAATSYENCVDCGECEEKCPYDLPIREMMPAAVGAFEEIRAQNQGTKKGG